MASVQYFDAEQVHKVLNWPMVNEAIKAAFIATSSSGTDAAEQQQQDTKSSYAVQPTRSMTVCGGKRSQLLLTMPAFVGNYKFENANTARNTLACKLVTSFRENSTRNPPLPNILANILLFSSETGKLESIVEGTQITAWRTASASIVATKFLFLEPETEVKVGASEGGAAKFNVAIIGCGAQGQSHAWGMCATYNVGTLNLWNRTKSKADSLAALIRTQYPEVNVTVSADPATAVAFADVICIATYSPNALINHSMIKKRPVHINAVGAGEVHFGEVAQDIYDAADVYIDSWTNAKVELKDLKAKIVGEVGEVIKRGNRLPKNDITLFQSMGMAAEDATVSHAVVEAIRQAKRQDF